MEATLDEDNGPAGGGDGGSSGGSCGGGRDNPSETANFLSYIFFWYVFVG